MDFDIVLQRLLKEYGISVSTLTRESTLHPSYIYKLLRGENTPSLHSLSLIAGVFGLKASELLSLTEEEA